MTGTILLSVLIALIVILIILTLVVNIIVHIVYIIDQNKFTTSSMYEISFITIILSIILIYLAS